MFDVILSIILVGMFIFLVCMYDILTRKIDKLDLEIMGLKSKNTVQKSIDKYNESVDPAFGNDPEMHDYIIRIKKEELK